MSGLWVVVSTNAEEHGECAAFAFAEVFRSLASAQDGIDQVERGTGRGDAHEWAEDWQPGPDNDTDDLEAEDSEYQRRCREGCLYTISWAKLSD